MRLNSLGRALSWVFDWQGLVLDAPVLVAFMGLF
jgi:hypothetical protein